MKNLKILIVLVMTVFLVTGCSFKNNKLDNAKIYTTIYPVKYIIEFLYGENSTVESIYPVGVDIDNYHLTEKQIDVYSSGDLFVYIGLGSEKEIAKSFLNKNDELLIIDATYGLNYDNDIVELWLAPNNFLMLLKNIKNSLNEYLDNTVKEDEVTKKYDKLYENVSWVDAELRNIAREAKDNNTNTLVVSSNTFKYLERYGFNVISIEELEDTGSETEINNLTNKFKNSEFKSIIKLDGEENSELMNTLMKKYKAKEITLNNIITNSDTASDYVSIQYENISLIRELLK